MAEEFDFSITGNDQIDTLQAMQLAAEETLPTAQLKLDFLTSALRDEAALHLLSKRFLVTSSGPILAKPPERSDLYRQLFVQDMMFTARLNGFSYMVDRNLPLESLVLNFDEPDVIIGLPEEQSRLCRVLRLQVPILAIESCVMTEEAA